MGNPRIDLGHDHWARWFAWAPDRKLNPQYDGIEDVARYTLAVDHLNPAGEQCPGGITIDTPTSRILEPGKPKWTLVSEDPLEVSPSLACRICGDHGWIRGGKWVPV